MSFVRNNGISSIVFLNFLIPFLVVRLLGDDYFLLSIVFQSLFSVFLFNIKSYRYLTFLFLSSLLSCFILFYYISYIDVIVGPDAIRYFDFINSYNNLYSIVKDGIERALLNASLGIYRGPGSYFIFGFPLKVYMLIMGSKSEYVTILFDLTFKLIALKILYDFLTVNERLKVLMLCILFLSPTFNYFVVTLGKDVFSFFLCVYALYLYNIKSKNIFFIIYIVLILGYSFLLRPYAPLVSLLYIAYNNQDFRKLVIIAVISFVVVLSFSVIKNHHIIFNWFIVNGFLFLTPNPFSISNYTSSVLLPTLFLIVALLSLILHFFYVKHIELSSVKLELISVLIYSAVMTLVGYYAFTSSGGGYAFGVVGDDIFRKQMLIIPMVIIFYLKLVLKREC